MVDRQAMPTHEVLRDRVYEELREALVTGRFQPGQKVTIRALATELGTSLTPVREALRRLVAEGALEGKPNRSVIVPVRTGDMLRELRDIRVVVEGLAAAKAAEKIHEADIKRLLRIAEEINTARDQDDVETDIAKVAEFQFLVYKASAMPSLLRIIESLWLQTGPYLNLLYPEYVQSRRSEWRLRLCTALGARDPEAARFEVENDVREALGYIATLLDAVDRLGPQAISQSHQRPLEKHMFSRAFASGRGV